MSRLGAALQQAGAALRDLQRDWALVGGLAVSVRAEPRFTRDLDLAIAVTGDEAAEHVTTEMIRRGFRLDALVEQEVARRLATGRLLFLGESETGLFFGPALRLLRHRTGGCRRRRMAGVRARPPRPRSAYGSPARAQAALPRPGRPQDEWDVVALLKVAEPADLEDARNAVHLITQRGFHRGKDLARELEELLGARAPWAP